ncbi:MAG: helix-turn-helix domain-containing protein [Lachnospiraceae bacterium]
MRRKELNYTQAYLSEFTRFSVTFISDLERGKPTAKYLGIFEEYSSGSCI